MGNIDHHTSKTQVSNKIHSNYKTEHRSADNDFSKPTQDLKFSEWETEFIPKNQNQLFDLIMAANFMNIESLINLCCAYVASLIKGKTTEEMREALAMEDEEEETEQAGGDAVSAE